MKNLIIVANWKMNLLPLEASELVQNINMQYADLSSNIKILVAPPSLYLQSLAEKNRGTVKFAAQNCHEKEEGAFTGEISAQMIAASFSNYVILGHSERRSYFKENNKLVNAKARVALDAGLTPIICIGETMAEREKGKTNSVLKSQLKACLDSLHAESDIIIAYEPIWAIGTGFTPTPGQILDTHIFIKEELMKIQKRNLPVIYGGSLNERNAKAILSINDVDGGLIGGASLDFEKFASIIDTARGISGS